MKLNKKYVLTNLSYICSGIDSESFLQTINRNIFKITLNLQP